jgi:hypothetical protein
MNTYKTTKQQIIEKYYLVLSEFIDKIQTSESITTSEYSNTTLSVGITAVHRVFEYTILNTKDIDKAYYQAQQTYYYLIEYLEQISESKLIHTLNHKDAVMFIYKKAIFETYDGTSQDKSNSLTNIMTLSSNPVNINDKEWRTLFIRISKCVNALLCWNNYLYDFSFRITICKRFLNDFLMDIERFDFITYYIEFMHQKFPISTPKYVELLSTILSKSEKSKRIRSGSITEQEKNEIVFEKLSIGGDELKKKWNTLSTSEFVAWLYK